MRRDSVRLQRDQEQLPPHLELKNASRDGEQERRFHRNTTKNLLPGARRLSPQQDLKSPSYDFSDDTLDDNYVPHDDMLQDVKNYAFVLDFGVETSAGTVELLLPQQASPGVTSPRGASPAGIFPWRVTPERPSPPPVPAPAPGPAPTPASAAPRAANGHANRGTANVTPAVTRSRAASLLPMPVATRYRGGRNNSRATLAELLKAGTLQRLSKLVLGPPCYTENIANQAKNASFNVEYAYVANDVLGRVSGRESKEQIPNAFKVAMILPQTTR